jgi:hypothetical protein
LICEFVGPAPELLEGGRDEIPGKARSSRTSYDSDFVSPFRQFECIERREEVLNVARLHFGVGI